MRRGKRGGEEGEGTYCRQMKDTMSVVTFHDSNINGKFQGTIAATTPIGAHSFISVSISCAQPIEVIPKCCHGD